MTAVAGTVTTTKYKYTSGTGGFTGTAGDQVRVAYEVNSFGSSILDFVNSNGIDKKIYKIGIATPIIPHGKRDELLKEFGLRGENLIKRIEEKIDAVKE